MNHWLNMSLYCLRVKGLILAARILCKGKIENQKLKSLMTDTVSTFQAAEMSFRIIYNKSNTSAHVHIFFCVYFFVFVLFLISFLANKIAMWKHTFTKVEIGNIK